MPRLEGTISITGLPAHRGLIVNLYFFAVAGPDSPVPHNGAPSAEAAADCDTVFEGVDLEKESQQTSFECNFGVERSPGYYHVQLRVILFRTRDGKVFAQAEQFFFGRQPLHIPSAPECTITLPVTWPTEPLESLHRFGTLRPQSQRPWWRFWCVRLSRLGTARSTCSAARPISPANPQSAHSGSDTAASRGSRSATIPWGRR